MEQVLPGGGGGGGEYECGGVRSSETLSGESSAEILHIGRVADLNHVSWFKL